MSAETLREAAKVLRERSGGAPRGPWRPIRVGTVGYPMTERMFGTVADTYPTGGSAEQKAVTDYIATMHPGVGLALADLLDFTANEHEGDGPEGCWECVRWTTITRLILGGAS